MEDRNHTRILSALQPCPGVDPKEFPPQEEGPPIERRLCVWKVTQKAKSDHLKSIRAAAREAAARKEAAADAADAARAAQAWHLNCRPGG